MKFITRPCSLCGKSEAIELDEEKYKRWRKGELIQRVWPRMTADERELLISGTHPKCWDTLFPMEEEE